MALHKSLYTRVIRLMLHSMENKTFLLLKTTNASTHKDENNRPLLFQILIKSNSKTKESNRACMTLGFRPAAALSGLSRSLTPSH